MTVNRTFVCRKVEYTVTAPDERTLEVACNRIIDRHPPLGYPQTEPAVVTTNRPAPTADAG